MILYLTIVAAGYAILCGSPRGRVIFAWYMGLFYDRRRRVLYIFLLPCLGVEWQRERKL